MYSRFARNLARTSCRSWLRVRAGATMTVMVERDLLDSVRVLRQHGRSPKEIARALAVPPAVVAPLVRLVAAERSEAESGCSAGGKGPSVQPT